MQSSIQNNQLHYHNPGYDFLLIADEGWMMYSNKDIEKIFHYARADMTFIQKYLKVNVENKDPNPKHMNDKNQAK